MSTLSGLCSLPMLEKYYLKNFGSQHLKIFHGEFLNDIHACKYQLHIINININCTLIYKYIG